MKLKYFFIFVLLCISCDIKKTEQKPSSSPNKQGNIGASSDVTLRVIEDLRKELYVALFMYYIDNKKFPSEKNGLAYGLAHTGKNAPYYTFEDLVFKLGFIYRKGGKSLVKSQDQIKKGDKIVYDKEFIGRTYKIDKKTNNFVLFGYRDQSEYLELLYIDPILKFKYLDKLRYEKEPKFQTGAEYFDKLGVNHIKFYLSE